MPSASQSEALGEFDQQPAVARIECDRFCDGCGYNLHTQVVRRDTRTQLLLCRCPECGRIHAVRDNVTAGRVWLQRLGTLALFVWMLVVVVGGFSLGAGQVGVTIGTLEELTTYRPTSMPVTTGPSPTTITISRPGRVAYSGGGNTIWQRQVREEIDYYGAFMALMLGLAFALGFALAVLMTVTMHHWPRGGYLVPVVCVPVLAGAIAWYAWSSDYAHLRGWAAWYVVLDGGANLLGGLVGVLVGRPFARLLATLILPPRLRQVAAFLWLADGKLPPRVATAREDVERCQAPERTSDGIV